MQQGHEVGLSFTTREGSLVDHTYDIVWSTRLKGGMPSATTTLTSRMRVVLSTHIASIIISDHVKL